MISFLASPFLNWWQRGLFFLVSLCLQLATVSASAQYTKLLDMGSNGYPSGSFYFDGTFLYTINGNNFGTIYKIKPDGTGYQELFTFDGAANGSYPNGPLISDGTFLYGTTSSGGTSDLGTLFKIKPDGTSFTKLLDFAGTTNGSYPGALIFDGSFLYGATLSGGTNDLGTIFKIMPDGSGYQKLHEFAVGANGYFPRPSLVYDGTFLFGATQSGGTNDLGTIFKIMPTGTGYEKIFDFDGTTNGNNPVSLIINGASLFITNDSGGANLMGTLVKINKDGTGYSKLIEFSGTVNGNLPSSTYSVGDYLYGATATGGLHNLGTLYKIKTDGTEFSKLLDFDGATLGSYPVSIISDGVLLFGFTDSGDRDALFKIALTGTGFQRFYEFYRTGNNPIGSLISIGSALYGMTPDGGAEGVGTIFKVNQDGTGYVTLYSFGDGDLNLNGSNPQGSLLFDGTFLYGMTRSGGFYGEGAIFKIKPDGEDFAVIYEFIASNASSGSNPEGSLITDGTYLYGMTRFGDNTYTVFKIRPDGTGYQIIHSEPDSDYVAYGDLFYDGTFLYGMTYNGGITNTLGNIFRLKPDGSGFSNLFDFDGTNGSYPKGSLISDGTFLYGMTSAGATATSPYTDGSIFNPILCNRLTNIS